MLVCGAALHVFLPAAAEDVKPSQPWAQEGSDLPADQAVRFGTLGNGVRYAVMRNATPPGQAALWMRIDAGSLMERDDQLGLAHFMEHMAFNSLEHFPKKDPAPALLGASLNAFTSFDQTAYQVILPNCGDQALDTGLLVLRDQAGGALLEPGEIDDTRGVVDGEARSANLHATRVEKTRMEFLYKGLKLPYRQPIGDLDIIRTAQRDRFVDYYDSYYRPSRATVIAVGDFDMDAMEARIRRTFGDWQPKRQEGTPPDLGTLSRRGEEAMAVSEEGVKPAIALNWVREPDGAADGRASRREAFVRQLGLAVLNRRLSALSLADDSPFSKAEAEAEHTYGSAETVSVWAEPLNGQWPRALDAIEQEKRRLDRYGVTDAELRREVASLRLVLEQKAGGAATRSTRDLAGDLDEAVNERRVFIAPAAELGLFEAAVTGLTPSAVNKELKRVFAGNGPLVTLVSLSPVEGGEAAVMEELRRSRRIAVAAPKPPVVKPWPYTDFGKPGAILSRSPLPGLGATLVTFANGVTLTVKPTPFEKDAVQVSVLTGAGEQSFPPDRIDPRRILISQLVAGGLGRMTQDEINLSLTGHAYGAGFKTLGDRFFLGGKTRPQDLGLEMQYLAAYLTDPAFRAAGFDKMKQGYPDAYETQLAQPTGAFKAESQELLAGGDKRKAVLKPDEMAEISMEDHRADLKALLAEGPIAITMVGDLTIEQAVEATAGTFGALPARPALASPAPGAAERHFPAPAPEALVFRHKGLPSQSLGYVAWPTTDVTRDLTEGRRLELLRAVLQVRVSEEIREKLAIAYSPKVAAQSSDTYPGYGMMEVTAQTVPDKLPSFFQAVDAIMKELQDRPVSDDDFQKARELVLAKLKRDLTGSNDAWLDLLQHAADRPWYLPQLLAAIDDAEAVTPEEIQALARKYLRPETAWKAEVLPP